MKLSKDKIIEAVEAFNQAESFDEFKVLLDLANVTLEDFEHDYYAIASIHPIFKKMISFDENTSIFNSRAYMHLDPRKILKDYSFRPLLSRFKLPLWFENDEFGTIKLLMPGSRQIVASYSKELVRDLARFGIDADEELAKTMMIDLGRK